jgi:competence protein ComEA
VAAANHQSAAAVTLGCHWGVDVPGADSNSKGGRQAVLLRRADQAAIAVLLLLALVSIAAYWIAQGGARGRLIEIDRAPRQAARFRIDINQAQWPEFSQLPGVGETLARRIVESRDLEGRFADIEELRRVRGIGPKTLEQIRPYLRPVPPMGNVADR